MAKRNEKIAVLILSYNGAEDTLEAIASLKNQRKNIVDIFVSDNNSNSNTKELLESNQESLKYTFLNRSENLGFAGGFNDLFQHALDNSEAEYFLVLNNDTEAEKGFVERLLEQAAPDKIVSPMILWHRDRDTVIQCAGDFDREMMKMKNLFAGRSRTDVPQGVHEVEQTDGCCFLIHRNWLEKGFRFDEKLFIYFEDVELFNRLRKEGVRFFYVTDSVLLHKEYGSSGGRDNPSAFRNYYFYRNRMYLVKTFHPFSKRFKIYWRLYKLAMEKYMEDMQKSSEAANAIRVGVLDGFLSRMGRRCQP